MRQALSCCVLIWALAGGCSDDDGGTPLQAAVDEWKSAYTSLVASYCACATDATSDYCQKTPTDCFSSLALCEADADPGLGDLDCYGAALQLDEQGSLPVAECFARAAGGMKDCLAEIADCSAPALNACIQAYDAAQRACPALPETVVSAYAKCQ